jgi:hypothetical protein
MAKEPAKHGQQWTPSDDQQLKKLIRENTPTRVNGNQTRTHATGRTTARKRNRLEHETRQPEAEQT